MDGIISRLFLVILLFIFNIIYYFLNSDEDILGCPRELRQFWTPNIISFYKDDKMLTIQLFVHHIYILLDCYGNR